MNNANELREILNRIKKSAGKAKNALDIISNYDKYIASPKDYIQPLVENVTILSDTSDDMLIDLYCDESDLRASLKRVHAVIYAMEGAIAKFAEDRTTVKITCDTVKKTDPLHMFSICFSDPDRMTTLLISMSMKESKLQTWDGGSGKDFSIILNGEDLSNLEEFSNNFALDWMVFFREWKDDDFDFVNAPTEDEVYLAHGEILNMRELMMGMPSVLSKDLENELEYMLDVHSDGEIS